MMDLLDRRDLYLLGGLLVFALFIGLLGQVGIITQAQEIWLGYAAIVPIIPALYYVYRARERWGGQIARNLELIGVGLAIHLVLWAPHIRWHILTEQAGSAPRWFGMLPSFWYVAWHGLSLFGFAIVTYGFYRFWRYSR